MMPYSAPLPAALRRIAVAACAALGASLGCGTQDHDKIPPELLAVLAAPSTATYPGPYGNQIGDIATNVCVQAWDDPKAQGYAEDALEERCLDDYYDPSGTESQLLLVNTSAVWCLACRSEYGGSGNRPSLQEQVEARWDAGLRVLGVMFQDQGGFPATFEDAAVWAEVYEVGFDFGLDDAFAMGEFADPELQPLNMLLDTHTMEILALIEGDQPQVLWPAVDALLGRDGE